MDFETSVDIDAGIVEVFEVLADLERWPEWTESMTRVRPVDAGPLAEGQRVEVTQPKLGTNTWTVTEVTPAAGFTWEIRRPGVHTTATHRLTAVGEGRTRLTLRIEPGGWLGNLIARMTASLTRRYMDLEANGLKRRCEQR